MVIREFGGCVCVWVCVNSMILASIFWTDFKRNNYKEFYSGFIAINADFDKQTKGFLILERQYFYINFI